VSRVRDDLDTYNASHVRIALEQPPVAEEAGFAQLGDAPQPWIIQRPEDRTSNSLAFREIPRSVMPWAWIQTIRIPTTLQGGRMGQAEQRRSRQITTAPDPSVELEETDHGTGRPIRTAKIELVEQSDVKTEDILAAEATVGDDTAARSLSRSWNGLGCPPADVRPRLGSGLRSFRFGLAIVNPANSGIAKGLTR
jgi:hypothetical protein